MASTTWLRPVLLAAALLAHILPAAASVDQVVRAVDGFVRPAYAGFETAAERSATQMTALCETPSADAWEAARAGFVDLVGAWSRVEILRFGPVTEENRLERILFWPDRKGIGLKQVQAALASHDSTASDAASLKGKSVAMQGLGALEFVLFGTNSEELATPGDPYRCAYGRAIADNIAAMAAEIDAAWQQPDGIAAQWSNPGGDNPLYRSDDEATTELFDVLVHGLDMVRDVRLNGFLGETPEKDRPRLAIFRRSGATAVSLKGNLDGLRDLFVASGLAEGLPSDSAWIPDSVSFEFRTIDTMLDGLVVGEALTDESERSRLQSVRLITSHLSELFGINLAAALGLSAGFSSLDGD
jgi:hypothetical protein